MDKRKILLSFALIAAIVFFIGFYIDNELIKLVSKPVPVIIFAFLLPRKTKFQKFIFYGLFFSVIGDILLELPFDLFVFGLFAFLLAHVAYILAFLEREKSINAIMGIILLLIGIAIFMFLFHSLGDMKIAVGVYMLIILTMVWRSYSQRKVDKYALIAFAGALLFMFSDTNIAFEKFYKPYELSTVVIMVTYWLGQYLIFLAAEKSIDI